jgi:hypothetical protein
LAYSGDLEEAENANLQELVQEPIFVSLGSYCETGHLLRACEIRKAAFPFDWITTIDSEKFLTILQEDFAHFLDRKFLLPEQKDPGPLFNTYYHLEFLHEGDFRGVLYAQNMQKFQSKYQRRIERFRTLREHQGKVIFLRTAYRYSTTDPHRVYYCADNIEISDEYAIKLYNVLKSYFPKLDFTLIIMNNANASSVFEEKRLASNLIKIRYNAPDVETKTKEYKRYFTSLVAELKEQPLK